MIESVEFFFGLLIAFILACIIWLTWSASAGAFSYECDVIGQFYVGKKVYECKRNEDKHE